MTRTEFRKLRKPNFIEQVVRIHRQDGGSQPTEDTPAGWYRLGGPWMHPLLLPLYLDEFLAHDGVVWVALVDGSVVAEAELEPLTAGEWFLSLIVVDPAYRGRGIGRALFERAARDVAHAGSHRIVTCPDNGAEGFYRSLGFKPAGGRCRIEGTISSAVSADSGWRSLAGMPVNLPMVLGHNQPPEHHLRTLSMGYQRHLGDVAPRIIWARPAEDHIRTVVCLCQVGTAPERETWLLAWSTQDAPATFGRALDCLARHSGGQWFSYVSEAEASQLDSAPSLVERWWVLELSVDEQALCGGPP